MDILKANNTIMMSSPMRIAAFNVENLFDRPKAFNLDSAEAQTAIQSVAELNHIFENEKYSAAQKERMKILFEVLEFNVFNDGPLAHLRTIRGKLVMRPRRGGVEIVAEGRQSWVGWAELKTAHVNEIAVINTGRVIRDVNADVLAVVEAENRISLKQFSHYVFQQVIEELPVSDRPTPYEHIMVIDGNDLRGIDVGIMTKKEYPIGLMRSHIHDDDHVGNLIYSRDCPEYCVDSPSGEKIWILPNHFKSKYGGNTPEMIEKRRWQALRTAEIYNALVSQGDPHVIVLGDLNDTPDSEALQPLLQDTDLKDISLHPNFEGGEFRIASEENRGYGTYGLGNDNDKIDYLLLSPSLFEKVIRGGLFRKGAWPGSRPKRWEVYPQLTQKIHVASDHHVIWADLDI